MSTYTCDICNKSFASAYGLSGHRRMHGQSGGTNKQIICCCIITRREISLHKLQQYQDKLTPCRQCSKLFPPSPKWGKIFCSHSCSASYNNKLRVKPEIYLTNRKKYAEQCKFNFNLASYSTQIKGFDLLLKHGMYHPVDNKHGVSRDHMFSISAGFDQKVDPAIISHPANCQILLHSSNARKNAKSSITLEELQQRISSWIASNIFEK